MKEWLSIKNNIFFWVFVSGQVLMLLLALNQNTRIKIINIDKAIVYHIFLTLCFCFGYLVSINKNNFVDEPKTITINKAFYYFCFTITTIGLLTSILTISAVYPIKQYVIDLLSYHQNKELLKEIKYNASTGGLPGIIKVINYSPLGVFFVAASYLIFHKIKDYKDEKILKILLGYSLLCSLSKTFFSLDRLTLLGVLIVTLYSLFYSKKKMRIYIIIILVILFSILSFITSARMTNKGVLEFLMLYCRLGLTNFELLIDSPITNYSFGLNTFLMPLHFIAAFFNVDISVPKSSVTIWDNAQYFYGYLFLDFGFFSFLVMFLLGILVAKLQKLVNKKIKYPISVFFVILFAISTFVVVPIIRGVEFWWMLMIGLIASLLVRYEGDEQISLKKI